MKFDVNKNELKRVLANTKNFTGNAKMPILDSIKVAYDKDLGLLTVEASSLDSAIMHVIDINKPEGKIIDFTVNHSDLFKLIKVIDYDSLQFVIEKHTLTITTPFLDEYSLPTGDANEFPVTSYEHEEKTLFETTTGMIKTIINEMNPFCGDGELRPVMNGVYFEFDGTDMVTTATNAYYLYNKTYKDFSSIKTSFIMPNHPAIKYITGTDVKISVNEKSIIITGDDYFMMLRKIEGNYPKYDAIIPQEGSGEFVFTAETNSFVKSLKVSAALRNAVSNAIVIEKKDSKLTIQSEDLDYHKKGTTNIQGNSETDFRVGYNGSFLETISVTISGDDFNLEGSAEKAGVIRETIDDGNIEKILLIMPIMIRK